MAAGYQPDGSFSLAQTFGTGTAPNNDFPPQVGDTLNSLATGINIATIVANPAFVAQGYLKSANNLSDVANPAAALANLDPQLTSNIRNNFVTASYTTVLADGEKFLLTTNTAASVITIAGEASVGYTIGTCITVFNFSTIPITVSSVDTMYWLGQGSIVTGSRVLSYSGMATVIKVTSTAAGGSSQWAITGAGLT